MKIRFAGEDRWVDEREYNASRGWDHNIRRLIFPDQYPALAAEGKVNGWSNLGFPVSDNLYSQAMPFENMQHRDSFAYHRSRLETQRKAAVQDRRYAMHHAREYLLGWYIPQGRIFPLGDNRDSSHDGRNFKPVMLSKVLGKGMIIYWPFGRMGKIE